MPVRLSLDLLKTANLLPLFFFFVFSLRKHPFYLRGVSAASAFAFGITFNTSRCYPERKTMTSISL